MNAVTPHALLRKEDQRLITGTGQFSADAQAVGMLFGHVIRSTHAHARITRLDMSAVHTATGVRKVLTAQDVQAAGFADLPNVVQVKDPQGQPQTVCNMPVLAHDKVLYVGQPVAWVVADTALQAQDAAELAQIDYDTLDVVVTFEDATAPGAVQLHPQAPGNTSVKFEAGDRAAVDAAFAKAHFVSDIAIESQRLVGSPMEPRAVWAWHDETKGVTHVHTPTQGVGGMAGFLAQITRWPHESMEVHTHDVGGSFGLRSTAYSEHLLVMLSTRELKKPVRWVGSRSEVFVSDWHGRALRLHGHIALDAQGHILAMRFENQVDVGAYNVYFSTHIGARNLSITMGGAYQVPALHMSSHIYFTNTVPVSSYRGAGRPDIAYAIDRLIDHAAHQHGLDGLTIRRKNFIPPQAFPYTTANKTVYDSGQFESVMDHAIGLSEPAGFAQRRADALQRGCLLGRGLAYYLEASGPGGAAKDQVRGSFDAQGVLSLHALTGASGQGHETSFAQIIENEIGLPTSAVRYLAGEPEQGLVGNGTGGSRTLYGAGSAIKNLCQQLMTQAKPAIAALWTCSEADIAHAKGEWQEAGGAKRRLRFADWITSLGAQAAEVHAVGEATSGVTFPNGCHIAEVEIHIATGVAEVAHYWAVDDVGLVISPEQVLGQVQGGVVQGMGQAFGEHAIYDRETGQLLTGSYMDYPMPRAGGLVRHFHHETHAVHTALNLLGSKGVGESGCSGSLPALANAVSDALRQVGAPPIDMPFTPAKLWAAILASPHKP
jgi:carbon-monoxide dehydrogenase large subunit